MDYNFRDIEKKWQETWENEKTYLTKEDKNLPKYYVLDMFPYPSGAGLHVGHPLGYIASDIVSRYKILKGFNVLHPMGYDAFGLPAEQYAIQTGQHPAVTTEKNILRYREQLKKIGFSYDWSREFRTSDAAYYKWTQWAVVQMFKHWFNKTTRKADAIENLIKEFEQNGNQSVEAVHNCDKQFTASEWTQFNEKEKQEILLSYRLAFLADTMVNWCPALGCVLANDEVKEGFSVRGGHPVEQRKMRQWLLRVSAYAERLLEGMDKIDWSESIIDVQKNWIGRSEGAEIAFPLKGKDQSITVFTTRPDTIYGATFMVIAPESDLVDLVRTPEMETELEQYVQRTKKRTERERMADAGKVTGCFTGSYAINPITGKEIPIWISEYVLAGYGTGAIMAVPAHDSRDFLFAKFFKLPIIQVIQKPGEAVTDPAEWIESYDAKEGVCINSDVINGMDVKQGASHIIAMLEKQGIGKGRVNFRLRDAVFSRQRYWGEPFPFYYKDGLPYPIEESKLPLELPEIDAFLPTEDGQPPLGRAENWVSTEGYPLELSTMPGFAGSSAYYLRYMDPHNDKALVDKDIVNYWRDVDLYVGGMEHATGHLIYARFWNKFLFDLGLVCEEEPFKKLVNQGMIQGRSSFVYRDTTTGKYISKELKNEYKTHEIHVDISLVDNDVLDTEAFKKWRPELADAEFIVGDDKKYHCGWAVEKMSKSMYNVVNPDDVIEKYGADTLRMYEMFLGPLEQSKPWDTNGIEGVHKFLRKTWRLFFNRDGELIVSEEKANDKELKVLHKLIKKVADDIEAFSFNTSVSAFMIAVNELGSMQCNKREILEPLLVCLSAFAPHMTEELWHQLGHETSVTKAIFPEFKAEYVTEDTFEYPVSFNGKMRFKMSIALNIPVPEIEKQVMSGTETQKWLEGKTPKKVIIVPGKIVNIVI
ncbi:MAG: leucine--tRNA ligase [Bacteroidetes bacterium HGW-Bacteroidetes-21]|nr:MAG: leucine--tRNA ligase [Bacteroidetes bacterium HGW-Bacteroidetes-21]